MYFLMSWSTKLNRKQRKNDENGDDLIILTDHTDELRAKDKEEPALETGLCFQKAQFEAADLRW